MVIKFALIAALLGFVAGLLLARSLRRCFETGNFPSKAALPAEFIRPKRIFPCSNH
jgi:hypothetical protein